MKKVVISREVPVLLIPTFSTLWLCPFAQLSSPSLYLPPADIIIYVSVYLLLSLPPPQDVILFSAVCGELKAVSD